MNNVSPIVDHVAYSHNTGGWSLLCVQRRTRLAHLFQVAQYTQNGNIRMPSARMKTTFAIPCTILLLRVCVTQKSCSFVVFVSVVREKPSPSHGERLDNNRAAIRSRPSCVGFYCRRAIIWMNACIQMTFRQTYKYSVHNTNNICIIIEASQAAVGFDKILFW